MSDTRFKIMWICAAVLFLPLGIFCCILEHREIARRPPPRIQCISSDRVGCRTVQVFRDTVTEREYVVIDGHPVQEVVK